MASFIEIGVTFAFDRWQKSNKACKYLKRGRPLPRFAVYLYIVIDSGFDTMFGSDTFQDFQQISYSSKETFQCFFYLHSTTRGGNWRLFLMITGILLSHDEGKNNINKLARKIQSVFPPFENNFLLTINFRSLFFHCFSIHWSKISFDSFEIMIKFLQIVTSYFKFLMRIKVYLA